MEREGESIYYAIQNRPLEISERDLSLLYDRARFDPRLMEVLTEFIRDFWWNLDPELINKNLKKRKSPSAIKPSLHAIVTECSFPVEEVKKQFIKWKTIATMGLKDVSPQLFYIGMNSIGGSSMQRELEESLDYFSRFNFFAKDSVFNKGLPKSVKTKNELSGLRFSSSEIMKSELAMNIRNFKKELNLTNSELMVKLGMNRSFASKILNSKFEGISLEYLIKASEKIPSRSRS